MIHEENRLENVYIRGIKFTNPERMSIAIGQPEGIVSTSEYSLIRLGRQFVVVFTNKRIADMMTINNLCSIQYISPIVGGL